MLPRRDSGYASIEFIFVGILALVPLLYLVLAVFEVERNTFAATHAAREAGRAFVSAKSVEEGNARARMVAAMALQDQGLSPGNSQIFFTRVTQTCEFGMSSMQSSPSNVVDVTPGAEFAICVTVVFTVPGVPSFLDGGRNTVTGRYLAKMDTFREDSV